MSRPLITAQAEKLRRRQLNAVLDWLEINAGGGGGGGAWGGITGTLSDQTDLQTALNAKADDSTLAATVQAYTLDTFADPVASVGFNGQQALAFVIENRTSDPGSPVTGQIWIRTDL
jgi:hypothetical protein